MAVNNDQERRRGSLGSDVDICKIQLKPRNIGSYPLELKRCQTTADWFQDCCRSYAKVSLHIFGTSLNPTQLSLLNPDITQDKPAAGGVFTKQSVCKVEVEFKVRYRAVRRASRVGSQF